MGYFASYLNTSSIVLPNVLASLNAKGSDGQYLPDSMAIVVSLISSGQIEIRDLASTLCKVA